MTTLEQVKAWDWLMKEVNKVPDYNTRLAMREDLRRKALRDWGWVPGEGAPVAEADTIELDAWEKEFYEDIKDSSEFGIDTRKDKREDTLREARANMHRFISEGRTLLDIPEEIRTPDIEQLFYEELQAYGDELMQQAANVSGNSE